MLLLKNLLFTLIVPGTVGVYVPLWVCRERPLSEGLGLAAGSLALVAGSATLLWCVADFAIFGRGTPSPIDAPKRLVMRGPYRLVRNPMYVGVLSVILGWSALFSSLPLLLYALAVGTAFHLFIVFYEEPRLSQMFGDTYRTYRSRTGRWFPTFKRT